MNALTRLLARLDADGDRPCLFEHGRWHGAAQLHQAVQHWRVKLAAQLPRRGAVLGMQATFSFDSMACLLAAWDLRAIVALLPPGADREALATQAHCDCVLHWDDAGDAQWRGAHPPPADALVEMLRARDEAGVIIFTSGTTGRPRAAVHAVSRLLGKYADASRALRTLAVLQMDHIAGLDAWLYTLCAGGALVLPRSRSPQAVCEAIQAAQVQVLAASPSFLRLLCATCADADLASVRIVTYGSEPMDPATLARVNALFPAARISQKYGTTELGAPRTASEGNDSLWIRLEGEGLRAEVRDGVLWVHSPWRFLGYLGEPQPPDDGWYCTGDRVEVRDGWMRILGRASEVISVGGEKVAPAQVEAVILELPEVVAALVQGEPNALLGQIVVAQVQLGPGAALDDLEKRIRQHCRARLPAWQVPVRVEVAEALVGDRHKLFRTRKAT